MKKIGLFLLFLLFFGMVTAVAQSADGPYRVFSQDEFEDALGQRRVYFFHASWCPTCRFADREINANLHRIPEDVVIFKTDYDSNAALKRKYGVTYQHTFVVVDDNGELVTKWNGGNFDVILRNLQN